MDSQQRLGVFDALKRPGIVHRPLTGVAALPDSEFNSLLDTTQNFEGAASDNIKVKDIIMSAILAGIPVGIALILTAN